MSREIIIYHKQQVLFVPLVDKYKTITGYAKADLDDYHKLKDIPFHKHIDKHGKEYAEGTTNGLDIKMHTLIYGKAPRGYLIDHKNSDGLDNRKCNLRYATGSQNSQNRIKEKGKYS